MSAFKTSLIFLVWAAAFSTANADNIEARSTGLTDPQSTLDFGVGEFDGVIITDQYAGAGVTFSADGTPWSYKTFPAGEFFNGLEGGHLTSGGAFSGTIYSIHFSGSVSGAAFNFKAFPGFVWNLTASRNGLQVGSFDFISDGGAHDPGTIRYYGFENIELDTLTFGRLDNAGFELDNLEFSFLSAVDQISDLVNIVINMNINAGISNALDAKLDATLKALEDANTNNDIAAVNALYAFCSSVEAQRAKKLSGAQADQLITAVNGIIATLDSAYSLCQ